MIVVDFLSKQRLNYFRFLVPFFFANLACLIARRFFVFLEREVLFFPTPVILFAMGKLYTILGKMETHFVFRRLVLFNK